jgi:hypothetical protein
VGHRRPRDGLRITCLTRVLCAASTHNTHETPERSVEAGSGALLNGGRETEEAKERVQEPARTVVLTQRDSKPSITSPSM